MQNPYNEGLVRRSVTGSTVDDCPYNSPLLLAERNQWIAGFEALQVIATGAEGIPIESVSTNNQLSRDDSEY